MRRSLGIAGAFALVLVIAGWFPFGLPYTPASLFSDAVVSHWGAADHLRTSIHSGEYPLWQETILAGGPFAANPLNKTAYPLQWLVVILPPLTHLNLLILLHLAIAAAGTWRWGRVAGLSSNAAMLSAVAYALAPRFWGHLGAGHLDIWYALAWLPWLLALLHTGPTTDNRAAYVLKLASVGAILLLADVRVALYAALLGGAYALYQVGVHREVSRLWTPLAALAPFVGLVAALVVPLLAWQPYLSRGTLTPDDAAVFSVAPAGFTGLLLPAHKGGVETMVYLGLPVLILALIGLFSRPRGERWFWVVTIGIAGLWAAGNSTPLWNLLSRLEFLLWFRVPGRAWFVVMLGAALLAGHGLDVLTRLADHWREHEPPKHIFWLRLLAAGTAGVLAVCGGSLLFADLGEIPTSAGVMLLLNSLGIGGVLLAVLLRRGRANAVALALLALTYADLGVTAVNRVEWRGPDAWMEPYVPLAQRLLDDAPNRIYSPNYALPQQVAHAAELRLFYGVDPFQLSGIVQAIEAGSGVPVVAYSVILPPIELDEDEEDFSRANINAVPNLEALARWDVSHVVADYEYDLPGLTYLDTVNGVNLYRNQVYVDLAFEDAPDEALALLPSQEQITALNQRTQLAIWISAVSWAVAGFSLTILSVQKARRSANV
jgi:hypothetical protein